MAYNNKNNPYLSSFVTSQPPARPVMSPAFNTQSPADGVVIPNTMGNSYGNSIDVSKFIQQPTDMTQVAGSATNPMYQPPVPAAAVAQPKTSSFLDSIKNFGKGKQPLSRAEFLKQNPKAGESGYVDYLKGEKLNSDIANANNFDWMGGANLALSAFDAYNKYNMQNEQMDLYRQQIADARAERARKNTTRNAYATAFANA